ncbi:sensor histidine kinase [Paucibacter sp. B51]|uniref:sensor histidine kinase n=1 Tax=Paucibacter sp. B51 TaxID=2993315 RepID=UPI0022EBF198|nr:HAMP domain-containing sensor histidine kinase [Paucibacter sp. B51]
MRGRLRRAAAQLWRYISEPSMLRGLVLAQAFLVCGLWALLLLIGLRSDVSEASALKLVPAAEAILSSAQHLADRPEALRQVLDKVDQWNRAEQGEDDPLRRISLLAWRDQQLLYATPGLPARFHGPFPPGLQHVDDGKLGWQVLTVQTPASAASAAADSDLRVSFLIPRHLSMVLLSDEGLALLLLPLGFSLPLLIVPSWLSVRWALRPWRRLSDAVARRDANDLRPIQLQAREQELRPLLQAINRLLEELREARARERRFVADAAHELRTPLAALRLYADSLAALARDPRQQPLWQGMQRSSERAIHLVNQLLSLLRSDIQGPQAEWRTLDLAQLLPEVMAEVEQQARQRHISLSCETGSEPMYLVAHADGLHSLFGNLLENAVKYSPEHSSVQVRLWVQDEMLCASISDQGPGIPEAWRSAVLERFTRLPGESQAGSGLGLAIVQSVLHSHGGQMQLDDAPGGGLCVSLRLPRQAAQLDGEGRGHALRDSGARE